MNGVMLLWLSFLPLFICTNKQNALHELHHLEHRLSDLEQETDSITVHHVLRQRLPTGCSYGLIPHHPTTTVPVTIDDHNSTRIILHLFHGKHWFLNTAHPDCPVQQQQQQTWNIFLNSLTPDDCLRALDFEWVECGGGGYAGIHAHPWKGQTYVFLCRESPKQRKPLLPHWIDGGNSLCAVFPTNWVPPPAYLLEVEPIPIQQKRKHPLITSVISHSYTPIRSEMMAALRRRGFSFHQFGTQGRTITMTQYLKSFPSSPHVKPTALEHQPSRVEKEDAIRWSKFHLALEHSSQNGYMSEKVWQCLRVGTVPIYFGAPEASFFLPPHSTIFVKDYDSYDQLFDYLEYLDHNDTAYLEYLQWRQLLLLHPTHPYTRFLQRYGQGEMFQQHLCSIAEHSGQVLHQLQQTGQAQPFQRNWTDWNTGQQCWLREEDCAQRLDFRDPPPRLSCTGKGPFPSLQPYSFPPQKS